MRMTSGLGGSAVKGGDEVGAWPRAEAGMEENGERSLRKLDLDRFASVLVLLACLSLGIHPDRHGEMKNRTLKDW